MVRRLVYAVRRFYTGRVQGILADIVWPYESVARRCVDYPLAYGHGPLPELFRTGTKGRAGRLQDLRGGLTGADQLRQAPRASVRTDHLNDGITVAQSPHHARLRVALGVEHAHNLVG